MEETKPAKDKMEYRYLGNTGLKVSILSLGNWLNNEDDAQTLECTKTALQNGINYFDTAEIYGLGAAETTLGKALKELNVPREKIIVSIKILKNGLDPNDCGEGRKHIIEGVKQSLKNLQLDYADIVFAHRYDRNTPIEETVRAMNYLIQKGLTFYWATSEWTADQIERAYSICNAREIIDTNYRDLFRFRKYGITAWSPLEGGILTGKYFGDKVPQGSRMDDKNGWLARIWNKNKADWEPKLLKLQALAKEKLDCSLAQVSIAWVIKNSDVSTAILGAMKPEQKIENLKALEVSNKLTKEILEEIENIMKNAPKGEVDYFNNFSSMPIRRNIKEGINKTEF